MYSSNAAALSAVIDGIKMYLSRQFGPNEKSKWGMTTVGNTYAQPTYPGRAALLRAIDSDDPGLSVLIIAAALEDEDRDFVETMCLRLSVHTNQEVRGNAILGFGHLARLSGRLSSIALQAVQRGLADRSEYVRGQANAAAGDIKHFLGIEVQAART